MEPSRHRGGGRGGRMFVSGVDFGFWPGDFGFMGAKSVVAVTVCSIARMSRSVHGNDVIHGALRQAISVAIRPEGVACRVERPDGHSIHDDLRPTG